MPSLIEPDYLCVLFQASPLLDAVTELLPENSPVRAELEKLQIDAGWQYQAFCEKKEIADLYASSAETLKMQREFEPVSTARLDKVLQNVHTRIPSSSELKSQLQTLLRDLGIGHHPKRAL